MYITFAVKELKGSGMLQLCKIQMLKVIRQSNVQNFELKTNILE